MVSILSKSDIATILSVFSAEAYPSPNLEQQPAYAPSQYSVLLGVFFSKISDGLEPISSYAEWISRLRYSHTHVFAAGKTLAKTFTDDLPLHPPDPQYLPWINAYPRVWRRSVASFSSEAWKFSDTVTSQNLETSYPLPDFLTWLVATILTISESESLKRFQIVEFYYFWDNWKTYLFASDALTVWMISTADIDSAPSTLVVENFRQRVRDSSHTCWGERYDPGW